MTSDRELTEQRAITTTPSGAPDVPAAHGDGEEPDVRGPFGEPAGRGTSVGSPPVYPVEGWHIRETDFDLDSLPQSETIFSLSNGYLGLRGNLEEGAPAFERGTYVNGFYESRPIVYPEAAYGYAQDDQAMLNVTDGKMISLKVDGDVFDVREGELIEHNRVLDLRRGFVGREVVWESPSGRRISVRTRRLVSLTIPHLACMEYEVEALGPESASPMTMEITSHLVANESDLRHSDDPREMAAFWGQVLKPVWGRADGERIGLGHRVERAKLVGVLPHRPRPRRARATTRPPPTATTTPRSTAPTPSSSTPGSRPTCASTSSTATAPTRRPTRSRTASTGGWTRRSSSTSRASSTPR